MEGESYHPACRQHSDMYYSSSTVKKTIWAQFFWDELEKTKPSIYFDESQLKKNSNKETMKHEQKKKEPPFLEKSLFCFLNVSFNQYLFFSFSDITTEKKKKVSNFGQNKIF